MLKKPLIYLLLFWVSTTLGQQYNFHTISLEDGLNQSQVYTICQDSRGSLWFGTRGGGISIYDGIHFRQLTEEDGLESNFINDIFEDSEGNIWIASDKGLNKYDGRTIRTYNKDNKSLLGTAVYKVIQHRSGDIWLATSYGVAHILSNGTIRHYTRKQGLRSNAVHDISFDHSDRLWIGTERGLCRLENEKITTYKRVNRIRNNHIRAVVSTDTSVWCGSYGGGISEIIKGKFTNFSQSNGLPNYVILTLFIDHRSNLWIGTEGGGVIKYDGMVFTQFTTQDGLSNNTVRAITQDSWGNMWFGTSGGGVSSLDGETFIRYNKKDGLKGGGVYSITADTSGNMWFGTFGGGATMYHEEGATRFRKVHGFTNNKVKALFTDSKSRVWLGSEGKGVFRFEQGQFIRYHYSGVLPNEISGNWIKKITEDAQGRMWFGTSGGGISIMDTLEQFTWIKKEHGLANNRVNDFAFDQDSVLWVATDDGISRLDSSGFMNFHELPSSRIKSVEIDAFNHPWFGSEGGGIFTIIDDSLIVYGQKQGLSSGNIYLLFMDASGFLWVGTEKGVDRIELNQQAALVSIKQYGANQGFKGIETCQNASYQDSLGNIWFGTVNDVTRYNPSYDISTSFPPKICLTGIKLPYESIEKVKPDISFGPWFNIPENLVLQHNENHITFEFIGTYLKNPNSVRYQWQLEGFEKGWSPLSEQRLVTYSNLPAGNYTFYVRAQNEEGVISKETAEFNFEILSAPPPFYKSGWFILTSVALSVLLIGLISYIIYYRIRKRNDEVRMERNLIALEQKALRLQMNPHFLFNCLNSIKGYISENKPQEAKIQLAKFAKLMRAILDNSREQFITLENEIATLKNYMDLEKLSHSDVFDYEVTLGEEIETESMSIPTMVIQPFVENAILHGLVPKNEQGLLRIQFELEKERILCIIEDNGVGREKTQQMKQESVQKHKSAAISITRERLSLFGKNKNDNELKIDITDLKDGEGKALGTRVEVRMPFI